MIISLVVTPSAHSNSLHSSFLSMYFVQGHQVAILVNLQPHNAQRHTVAQPHARHPSEPSFRNPETQGGKSLGVDAMNIEMTALGRCIYRSECMLICWTVSTYIQSAQLLSFLSRLS